MAKRSLGHYDAAHNTIVVSRVFDRPSSPRYAIEYLLYHEMLHLKHPVKMRGLRRCVHPPEFKAEEALFPQLAEAMQFINEFNPPEQLIACTQRKTPLFLVRQRPALPRLPR
jgi:hypothetical protein